MKFHVSSFRSFLRKLEFRTHRHTDRQTRYMTRSLFQYISNLFEIWNIKTCNFDNIWFKQLSKSVERQELWLGCYCFFYSVLEGSCWTIVIISTLYAVFLRVSEETLNQVPEYIAYDAKFLKQTFAIFIQCSVFFFRVLYCIVL